MKRECETCIKRKTPYCPPSMECMATDDMPYYQNRIMLLEENQKLNGAIQTYDILLKANVEENQELKKQLEEHKATNEILSQELTKDKVLQQDHLTTCCGIPIGDIPKLITQQKEFIKYLEDEYTQIQSDIEKETNNNVKYFKIEKRETITEISQKYKEIIGVSDEN